MCLYSFPCLKIRVEIEDTQDRGNSYISISTQNSIGSDNLETVRNRQSFTSFWVLS